MIQTITDEVDFSRKHHLNMIITKIPRFEQIQTPHKTLDKEIQNMMMYQVKK
jgi:hypothetical protein